MLSSARVFIMRNTAAVPDSAPHIQRQVEDDSIDLLKFWRIIWGRKWSIFGLVFVVSLVAALAAFTVTPIYRAVASLLIEEKAAKVLSIEQIYGADGSSSEYLQTQFELLKSRALAERVVTELKLVDNREFDPRQQPSPLLDIAAWKQSLSGFFGVPPAPLDELEEQTKRFDEVTRAFMERVKIEPQGKSKLVKVQVEMADPRLAMVAANALANGFIERQLEASQGVSLAAGSWMSSRLDELRGQLKDSEELLQRYREAENLVDVGGVGTISAAELAQTGDRMIDARRQRAEAESQYRQVQSIARNDWQRLGSVPAVLGHPLIQQFKADEARARAKVEELSKRYGARHPAMEAARSELSAASGSLRGQIEQVVAGIERNYQLAQANQTSLQSSFDANKSRIQEISRKEFKLRELQREVDANRTLYETFTNRLKETAATSDLNSVTARVVDPAVLPDKPAKPHKALIVFIAAMLTFFVAAGLALLLDALNNTFKTAQQIEDHLNISVLGVMPLVEKSYRNQMSQVFHRNLDRRFSEAVRSIRTGIVLSGIDNPHQVLLVTSSVPAEGKSALSISLACALGQLERVLLIDADMRRPSLAKSFQFPAGTPGLANLLAGTATEQECIRQVNGIDVLCAGSVPPNPLELLSSPRFAALLNDLKDRYQRIIFDSAPTQVVSDALHLSTYVDFVIYVSKWAATPIPLVEKGIGQLLQNKAPVKGIVLNQMDFDQAKGDGQSYDGYYEYHDESRAT